MVKFEVSTLAQLRKGKPMSSKKLRALVEFIAVKVRPSLAVSGNADQVTLDQLRAAANSEAAVSAGPTAVQFAQLMGRVEVLEAARTPSGISINTEPK